MSNSEFADLVTVSLVTTCLALLIINAIKWRLNRAHLYALAAKIPAVEGIRMLPIIGHGAYLFRTIEELIAITRRLFAELKPPQKVWVWHELLFVMNRAEDMETVLNSRKCLSKHDVYHLNVRLTGKGLFILPVPEWRAHRKTLTPTFNQKILDGFAEVFWDNSEIFVETLRSKTEQIVNIADYTYKYALDILCQTAMGIHVKEQLNYKDLEGTISRTLDIIAHRGRIPPYYNDFIYSLSSLSREEVKLTEKYRQFVSAVIEQKVAEFKNKKEQMNNNDVYIDEKHNPTFLELLLELSDGDPNWTNEDILGEVTTFLIAGSDTTSTAESFTMVLLGMHPEIQEKCFEEVKDIIGMDRKIEYSDLSKFVYLEQVIKETMRLFPGAPTLLRNVDEDLEVGGYVLPKGSGLVLYVLAMHYSETYYKNPWTFDPDRFTPEEIAKRHKYAYLPFSAGPRNCIGSKFAMMAMKMLLANVIRNYRMETTYKDIRCIRIKQSIAIKAVDGHPVRFFARN